MPLLGNASLLRARTPAGGYGALTTDYETRVISAGGTISTLAKDAVEAFFYTLYSDGASGTGRVADFASLFTPGFLWGPVSNFTAVVVPLIGSNFTNSGYVSGDWSTSLGLQCGSGKHLDSGVLGSALGQNNVSLFHYASALTATGTTSVGARVGSTSNILDIGGSSSTTLRGRINRGTGTSLTRAADAGANFCLGRRNSSANFEVWTVSGGTLGSVSVASTSVAPPGFSIYVGGANESGTLQAPFTSRLSMAGAGAAPTDAQINILNNAAAAFYTSRAGL